MFLKKLIGFFGSLFLLQFSLFSQQKTEFFWDEVKPLSEKNSYFPLSVSDDDSTYIFFESADKSKKEIKISYRRKEEELGWSEISSLPDSFRYSGDEVPDMYSAAVSDTGVLAVSVLDSLSASSLVKVYSSSDKCATFTSFSFPAQKKQIASSRIFATSGGGFIIFISLGEGKQSPTESSFSLLCSESADGKNWSELRIFKPSESIANAFSPFYTRIADKDFVFFEGWSGRDLTSSLIYGSSRPSSSSAWSSPFIVTDDSSMEDNSQNYLDYRNFRPFVLSSESGTKIVWERSPKNSNSALVMVSSLNSEGRIEFRNDVESLNSFGNGRRPSLFLLGQKIFALWFDDRNGVNNVHLAENLGVQWLESDSFQLRQSSKLATAFPAAMILKDGKGSLSVAWQEEGKNGNRIMLMSQDYSAEKPVITARNFKEGKAGNIKNPAVSVSLPRDISGVDGFCALFTFDKDEEPDSDIHSSQFHQPSDKIIRAKIDDDIQGDAILYFKARLLDKAGNWSSVAVLPYYFDQTPPARPENISFDRDEWGFALSNDLSLSWKENDDKKDISGYSWSLTRIAGLDKSLAVSKTKKLAISPSESEEILASLLAANEDRIKNVKEPPAKVMTQKASVSFRNRDNGIYLFSVRAIDEIGNAGESERAIVFLNKYKAATLIKNVSALPDDFGNVSLSISGEEFSYDGRISEVIITSDDSGEKYRFEEKNGDFKISGSGGDREVISGIKIDGMKAGKYSVQIRHSERGLSSWSKKLLIGENGTVKYEKQYNFEPIWKILPQIQKKYSLQSERLLFWTMLLLVMLGILVSSRGLLAVAHEAVKIRKDVESVLTGEYMEKEKIEKMEANLKVHFSLRLKFGLAITALLLFIVAGVAFVIGYEMSRTQERILISGLKDRVKVVMGNMASAAQSYLPDGREKLVDIGEIINQTNNFAEARHASILSYEIDGKALKDGSRPMDYVWASNDEDILHKIDKITFDAGTVRHTKASDLYAERCKLVNEEAKKLVENLPKITGDNSDQIFRALNAYSAENYTSSPEMSDESLDRNVSEYMFFWPVLYKQGENTDTYLHAMIMLDISTDTLISQINSSRLIVASIAGIAAIVAAVIALISAFALSSIIVSPIRRIVAHVKKITDTENKLLLEGVEIKITSHDELRTLGDSVNDMTKGLVKGAKDEERAKIAYQRAAIEREKAARAQAEEAKARAEAAEMNIMNLDGQAVQKAFIPLVSEGAEKATVAELKEKEIQLYGYYEGTDAVSGDYFDYKKLDDRWYAFIKCDASGHGVPAALIMTIVATIFRRYFASWKFEKNGVKLNLLAADINDFIESLGLRGKFAAMMICLFDTRTGDVYTCNAGDNILRIFDAAEKKIKVITLHEAPAAGPLPSFMVEMKGGYKVEKIHLKANDVLFLYTDGIEESTRFFRDKNFNVIACEEPGLKDGEIHATHKRGEQSEQMEPSRVQDIIESVLNKKKYSLTRYHSPIEGEKLEFDFSKCQGTIEEAIIALTAVEKVFRMYKKPGSQGKVEKTEMELDGKRKTVIQISGDGIKIDRKIDAFLAQYFNRYDYYCVNKVDAQEANYVYYTGVSEDVQADDLTLLAIKKM